MNLVFVLLALAWQGGGAVSISPVVLAQAEVEHGHSHDMAGHADSTIESDEAAWDEELPRRESYLFWMYKALGMRYSFLFLLTGPLVFFGSLLVVVLCKRPAPIAAFFPILALPVLIGIFGFFDGLIVAMSVVSNTSVTPKAADMAEGFSMALVTPLVGMVLAGPPYLILSVGLFLRTLMYRGPGKEL